MTTIHFLADWALRSSILIATGALLLLAFRVRDVSVRLAVWTAMLCGSLAIPAMTVTLPRTPVMAIRMAAPPIAAVTETYDTYDVAPILAVQSAPIRPRPFDWTRTGIALYALIASALLLRVLIGLVMSLRLLRSSRATNMTDVSESDLVLSPVTLGIIRPAIVLPSDWSQWDSQKLSAVLAHERSHIRRYDPVVQLASAIHRALLWHSPLSWLLHSRIVRLAECASDDAAVAVSSDRATYAEVLLEFMQLGGPLRGVPMARYGRADQRIQRILDGANLSRGVTRWSVAAILVLGSPLAYVVAMAHPENSAPVQLAAAIVPAVVPAVAPAAPVVPVVPQPRVIAQVAVPPAVPEAPAAADRPKFDVASIKPCDPDAAPPGRGGRGAAGGAGAGSARFRLNCVTVKSLIADAYVRFADGQIRDPMTSILTKVEGGPAWLNSDQYTIEAVGDGPATAPMMAGPMMQVLLEDRFQLKVHRETREGPVYQLTLAKSGSGNLAAKGTPCVAADFLDVPGFPFRPGDDRPCRLIFNVRKGSNMVMQARGLSMEQVVESLTGATGRLVIDKTGIAGNVDLNLVYAPEVDASAALAINPAEATPTAEDPPGPSIFTALEQIGLKLVPARGAREYLVIDSVSRPSAN